MRVQRQITGSLQGRKHLVRQSKLIESIHYIQSVYLFDGADHLELGRGVEVVAFLAQQQAEVPRDVSPGNVHTHDGVRYGKALVDGHHVGYAVARIKHDTGGATCGVPAGVERSVSRIISVWRLSLQVLFLHVSV